MNYIYGLCSCTPLKQMLIHYLNSNHLNEQVLEQQLCSEQNEPYIPSIYQEVKSRSFYIPLEVEEEENQHHIQPLVEQPANTPLPKAFASKSLALRRVLNNHPTNNLSYNKIYDSQDNIALKVYSMQDVPSHRGKYPKKYSVYWFEFNVKECSLNDYINHESHIILNVVKERKIIQVLSSGITIVKSNYSKVLVVPPHQIYTAEKCEVENNQAYYTVFSVREQQYPQEECKRGWVQLAGIHIKQHQQGLSVRGYLDVQIQIGVAPSMMKQPIAKQIYQYATNMQSALTHSDAI